MRSLILSLLFAVPAFGQTIVTQTIREDGTGDFTTVVAWEAQNLNLVGLNQKVIGQIDGLWSAHETAVGGLTMVGWQTDDTRTLTLEAIGQSRHDGVFAGGGKYVLAGVDDGQTFTLLMNQWFTTLRGFSILGNNTSSTNKARAIEVYTSPLTIENMLIRRTLGDQASVQNYGIYGRLSIIGKDVNFINCVADGFQIGFHWQSGLNRVARFLNCTTYNCQTGFSGFVDLPVQFCNCLAVGGPAGITGFSIAADVNPSTGNISTLETPPGSMGKQAVVTLRNPQSADYHLADTDTEAVGYALPDPWPTTAPYSTDYEGQARGTSWDTGADQMGGSVPSGRGQVIITSQ